MRELYRIADVNFNRAREGLRAVAGASDVTGAAATLVRVIDKVWRE
jgi:hypothetical protein